LTSGGDKRHLEAAERAIGVPFEDRGLLRQALTHASYPHESGESPFTSNERLEFLGDALIGIVVAEHLYQALPRTREGELTVRRSHAVRKEALASAARRAGLGEYLAMGEGERASGGRDRESNLANAFEAVVGAIFADRGYQAAREFVRRALHDEIEAALTPDAGKDPKSLLQERLQADGLPLPEYLAQEEFVPGSGKPWRIAVIVDGSILGAGEAERKVDAERQAALEALVRINQGGG
jgi:ribonuclease III